MKKTLLVTFLVLFVFSLAVSSEACQDHNFNLFVAKSQFDLTRMRAQVDPIVQHGVSPSAHPHDFWCFIRVTQFTVANSTLPAGTTTNPGYSPVSSTCGPYGDWPEIWNPTPLVGGISSPGHTDVVGGRVVANYTELMSYRSPKGVSVLPTPYGMAVVAGNSHATSSSENPHLSWTCGSQYDGSAKPVDCTRGGQVTAVMEFPDCWNQQHGWGASGWDPSFSGRVSYDSPAGIGPDNFAYSNAGQCPVGFTNIVQLVTRTKFVNPMDNTPMQDPTLLSFSSGPYYTFHVDYLNLWSSFHQTLTMKCNNLMPVVTVDCLTGLGATADEAIS